MIFVTVGTHEQEFNRLVGTIDKLKGENVFEDDVFIQNGYSSCSIKHCKFSAMLSYEEMIDKAREARIIITHGGPGSIFLAWQFMKVPIVVPRMEVFEEHVDNHQVEFVRKLDMERKILVVYEIDKLGEAIMRYDENIKNCNCLRKQKQNITALVEKLDLFCQH